MPIPDRVHLLWPGRPPGPSVGLRQDRNTHRAGEEGPARPPQPPSQISPKPLLTKRHLPLTPILPYDLLALWTRLCTFPASMKYLLSTLGLAALAMLSGCATGPQGGSGGSYHVTALKPHNPNDVSVKVSTSTQNIYVMEGNRCLMAVQGCVGEHGATPLGQHHVMDKIRSKRSGSFGFTASGGPADIHKGQSVSVGYPMGFWCEFAPSYGFHEGFVWSIPRTHGCIRLHKEAAARLFALVKVGTPVSVQTSQPEDATFGKSVRRLDQRNDKDPSPSVLMSPSYFQDPAGTLLTEG